MQIKSRRLVWKKQNRIGLIYLALKHRSHSFGNLRKKGGYDFLVKRSITLSLYNRYHLQSFTKATPWRANLLSDSNMSTKCYSKTALKNASHPSI
tara:strand:+ start:206 stop:490 length:285 start_codon:yes stop_codon:yes gene_type:complete